MQPLHLDVAHFSLNGLTPNTSYEIQLGYALVKSSRSEFDWSQSHTLTIKTLPFYQQDSFHFFAGSCRFLPHLLGHAIQGEKGDKIFKSMTDYQQAHVDSDPVTFLAFIGDQIYADATGFIGAAHTAEQYEGYYQRAFSQPHIRNLMRGLPTYMMRDDHEWWNDSSAESAFLLPDQNKAAYLTYSLFERPFGLETPEHWYTTSNGIDAFFTDTRSERLPSHGQIMSARQLNDLKKWLIADERADRIKIVLRLFPSCFFKLKIPGVDFPLNKRNFLTILLKIKFLPWCLLVGMPTVKMTVFSKFTIKMVKIQVNLSQRFWFPVFTQFPMVRRIN